MIRLGYSVPVRISTLKVPDCQEVDLGQRLAPELNSEAMAFCGSCTPTRLKMFVALGESELRLEGLIIPATRSGDFTRPVLPKRMNSLLRLTSRY
jgi:hypothetical protein